MPLSPQARTGLLAVGGVMVTFALTGMVVLVVVAFRKNADANGGVVKVERPDVLVPEREREVRNHKWWKRPLTQAQLDRIIERAIDTKPYDLIAISQDADLLVMSQDGQVKEGDPLRKK